LFSAVNVYVFYEQKMMIMISFTDGPTLHRRVWLVASVTLYRI